jgi:hypothetical protein
MKPWILSSAGVAHRVRVQYMANKRVADCYGGHLAHGELFDKAVPGQNCKRICKRCAERAPKLEASNEAN